MTLSKHRKALNKALAEKALLLYKEGLTLREVATVIGRSHQWVNMEIKKLDHE